jgi:hypothetical protein
VIKLSTMGDYEIGEDRTCDVLADVCERDKRCGTLARAAGWHIHRCRKTINLTVFPRTTGGKTASRQGGITMGTSELIAALAIAMVCNDMESVRRTLDTLTTRMTPEQIGALLTRLDEVRAPQPLRARTVG